MDTNTEEASKRSPRLVEGSSHRKPSFMPQTLPSLLLGRIPDDELDDCFVESFVDDRRVGGVRSGLGSAMWNSRSASPQHPSRGVLGSRQAQSAIAGLLPSETACCITSGHASNTLVSGSADSTTVGAQQQQQRKAETTIYKRTIVTPPPHISKSALSKSVALLRFILFPDYLWQPERHRHAPNDADATSPRPLNKDGTAYRYPMKKGGEDKTHSVDGHSSSASSSSTYGAVPHFFERSLLADARVNERHRVLRTVVSMLKAQRGMVDKCLREVAETSCARSGTSEGEGESISSRQSSVSTPEEIDARERDEAVLAAIIRLTEILEVQIYRGFLAVAYEDGIRHGGVHKSKASTVRSVRKEGGNGGRPKFDLNWLPDLNAPTESAAVAASGCTCVCSVADPAALRVRARNIAMFLIERLPKLRILLHLDVEAVFLHDVAAHSIGEVVLCYPGIYFMAHQRLAHELYLLGAPNHVTRLLTEIAHTKTGIDIHPHTSIGHSFFMDHCTGIVIGATSIIGNRVSIYQGVTLGAKAFPLDPVTGEKIKNLPRHPIIEDDVTIYANASVLGRVTIGAGSVIGGNVWLAKSIPPNTTVLQGPMHLKMINGAGDKDTSKKGATAATKEVRAAESEARHDDGNVREGKTARAANNEADKRKAGDGNTGAHAMVPNEADTSKKGTRDGEGSGGYPARDVAEVSDEAVEVSTSSSRGGGGVMGRHRAAHLLGDSFISHL